ncbi:winged helix-turn-helix transcriptional regulator [Terribacillus saccharophilus]|uniref:winged helix-turn-helix transcriptional regulator n=1 Tax=Terribacillus saccharophilus TaxID=361277 RepID=UPI003D292D71
MGQQSTPVLENVCPTAITFALISGKWKVKILWHLSQNESLRFNELQRKLPVISHKVLSSQLNELLRDNLIQRKVIPHNPPKVEYSFTKEGKSLIPLLHFMNNWAKENKLNM